MDLNLGGTLNLLHDGLSLTDSLDKSFREEWYKFAAIIHKPKAVVPLKTPTNITNNHSVNLNLKPAQKQSTNLTGHSKKHFKNGDKKFKQLLSEYNRGRNSLPGMRSAVLSANSYTTPKSAHEFGYDLVEVMQVPDINGKILRPESV